MNLRTRIALVAICAWLMIGAQTLVAAGHLSPRGDRNLSLGVTMPEAQDYDMAIAEARSAGIQSVTLTFQWDLLEPTAEIYDDTFPDIANIYYPAIALPIDLAVIPISTNRRVMPPDLIERSFDDPEVIARFQEMLRHVLGRMDNVEIRSMVLGLEVDALLGTDEQQWSAFSTLIGHGMAAVRDIRPEIPLGVEGFLSGRTGETGPYFAPIDAISDFIAVSYYPLDERSQVRGTEVVAGDFDALVAAYPDRQIEFFQCGYPASPLTGSSEMEQAEFMRAIFTAWDTHANQIQSISFTWMHDITPAEVNYYEEFYGLRDPAFAAFLGSLGLRTFPGNGESKPAWTALGDEAAARGW